MPPRHSLSPERADADAFSTAKRRIAELEDKINSMNSTAPKQKRFVPCLKSRLLQAHSQTLSESAHHSSLGRAIRRLVSMFDDVNVLVGENDRRDLGDDDEQATEA
jgi:hypothetical protein